MTKTHRQFEKELKEKNPKVILIGKYTKAVNYIKVKCPQCGHIWEAKAYSLLQGRACPKCKTLRGVKNNTGKTKKKTTHEFVKELSKVNNDINIISEYKSHHSYIKCECKRCGNVWESKAYSLLQGHGCPRCAKSGTSFMEQYIYLCFCWLVGKNNVLSRDKKTIGMELDIYIPNYQFAIEPGNWNLHKNHLNRDKKKRQMCKKMNIKLITIYDKFKINENKPFAKDAYYYVEDLNKANREVLNNLIEQLFKEINVHKKIPSKELKEIEIEAYKNSKSMTHKEFVTRMRDIHPDVIVIGRYTNSNKRVKVKCKKCGREWDGVPANMLSGDGCWRCGRITTQQKLLKPQNIVEKEILQANPDVEIIGKYKGRHHTVKTKCKICGYIWEPRVSSLLRGSSHKGSKAIHNKIKN